MPRNIAIQPGRSKIWHEEAGTAPLTKVYLKILSHTIARAVLREKTSSTCTTKKINIQGMVCHVSDAVSACNTYSPAPAPTPAPAPVPGPASAPAPASEPGPTGSTQSAPPALPVPKPSKDTGVFKALSVRFGELPCYSYHIGWSCWDTKVQAPSVPTPFGLIYFGLQCSSLDRVSTRVWISDVRAYFVQTFLARKRQIQHE